MVIEVWYAVKALKAASLLLICANGLLLISSAPTAIDAWYKLGDFWN